MQAIIYEQYGPSDVLHLAQRAKPTPADDEVLIRVHAATVTTGDVNMRGFTFVPAGFGIFARLMFGIRKPRQPVLGVEVAGDVVAIGSAVTQFQVGDAVFGIDSTTMGGYAEYVCRRAAGPLAHKPANLSYAEAASLPFGAGTALDYLRDKAQIQAGQRVLVLGASGGTGSAAVQLAHYFQAHVTGVCSTRNVELVAALGADHVIDYTQQSIMDVDARYDIIFAAVPEAYSFAQCRPLLTENGVYLAVAGSARELLGAAFSSQLIAGAATESAASMRFLADLAAAGHLQPVIDRTFPLAETAAAHHYVDTGRKRGNVVITVAEA